METQDKLNAIAARIEGQYESTKDMDKCCGLCVGIEGIPFAEIATLVKKVLIDTGIVVPIKVKMENLAIDLETLRLVEEWSEFVELIDGYHANSDLPRNTVKREIVKIYKENEWEVPTENKIKGWKLNIVECFKNNPTITVEELEQCLLKSVKGPENAKHYAKAFHEFAKQLVAIGMS